MLAGFAVLPTASAQAVSTSSHRHWLQNRLASATEGRALQAVATTCTDGLTPSTPAECPTITSVTVGNAWIRISKTTPITFPVTVVVNDPGDIVVDVGTLMGRGIDPLQLALPNPFVGFGYATLPPVLTSISTKTFTYTVVSPYNALDFSTNLLPPAYGGFQINTVLGDADLADPVVQNWKSGTIKALSKITNTPSVTTVLKGHSFTIAGRLTRFDGTPQGGQKVNVYYVPAGQTRASFAGSPTTSSNGTFSLPVRSWFTGSWFVNFPGSAFSTGIYKAVWVRVS